ILRGRDIAAHPTPGALFGAAVDPISLRVDVSASETVAWAAALLRISGKRGDATARATWVVVKRGGALRVVQTHLSLPLDRPLVPPRRRRAARARPARQPAPPPPRPPRRAAARAAPGSPDRRGRSRSAASCARRAGAAARPGGRGRRAACRRTPRPPAPPAAP